MADWYTCLRIQLSSYYAAPVASVEQTVLPPSATHFSSMDAVTSHVILPSCAGSLQDPTRPGTHPGTAPNP